MSTAGGSERVAPESAVAPLLPAARAASSAARGDAKDLDSQEYRLCGVSWRVWAALAVIAFGTTVAVVVSQQGTPSSGTAPANECAWTSYRLPSSVVPIAYNVSWDIATAFAPPFSFSGHTSIDVELSDSVACVLVHARDLNVTECSVALGASDIYVAASCAPDAPGTERLVVTLPSSAVGLSRLRLFFRFTGLLSDTVIGFYGSSFVANASAAPRRIVQTKFEPSFARTAFPCFDEPAMKATFALDLVGVPAGYTALANMPIVSQNVSAGTVAYARSPIMSTYQLTAVVAPMVNVTAEMPSPIGGRSLPVTCFAMMRDNDATRLGGLAFALSTALATLSFYERQFGIAYALPKLDLVYLPAFPVGAMEQWGLVTFTESYLASGINGSASAAGVVAHELAHQYFGNLITAEWWSALWLQEGMATYWPNIALPATAPALAYEITWRASTSGAMAEDAFAASQPLTRVDADVASSGASYAMFGTISYDKGAAVIAGLRRRCDATNPGGFISGVTAWLTAHAYGSVVPDDLLSALAIACRIPDLAAEVDSLVWAPGVPLITAAWNDGVSSSGSLRLSQSRYFVSSSSAAAAGPSPLWTVPLAISAATPSAGLVAAAAAASTAFSTSGGYSGTTLVASLPYNASSDGWLTLSNGTGSDYVRVSLPREALEALSAALARDVAPLPSADAVAAVVDDVFALAEARIGVLSVAAALQWVASWSNSSVASLRQVRSALSTRVSRIAGMLTDDVPPDHVGNASTAPAAATPGTPQYVCLSALSAFVTDVLGLPRSSVPIGADRAALSASLTALPLDASNASGALTSVAGVPAARDLAWSYFTTHYGDFVAWYGFRSTLATLARSVGGRFTSAAMASEVRSFWTSPGVVASAPVTDGAWQRSAEASAAGAEWAASADAAEVCTFLSAWATNSGIDLVAAALQAAAAASGLHVDDGERLWD